MEYLLYSRVWTENGQACCRGGDHRSVWGDSRDLERDSLVAWIDSHLGDSWVDRRLGSLHIQGIYNQVHNVMSHVVSHNDLILVVMLWWRETWKDNCLKNILIDSHRGYR